MARPGSRYPGPVRPGFLLLAFCLGAAARLCFLGGKSFWHDEALSLLTAARPTLQGTWNYAMTFNFGAPAHALALRGWLFLGGGEARVRLLSVAGSLVALGFSFALVQAWLPARSAVPGLMLAALLPFSIEYAQEARGYAWLAAFELGMTLALARALADGRRPWRGLYAGSLAAGVLAHPAVWVWWCAQAAGLAATRRGRALLRGVMAASAPAAALAVALAFSVREAWAGHLRIGYLRPAAGEFLRQAAILFGAGHHAGAWGWRLLPFVVPALAAAGVWALGRESRRRPAAALLAMLTVLPVVAVYAGIAMGASAQLRYIPAAPVVLACLLAAGAGCLPWPGRAAAVALLLGLSAEGYLGYHTRPPSLEPSFCLLSKKPLRDVAALISREARPGDAVAHLSTASCLPMRWYAPGLRQDYIIGNPDFALAAPGLPVSRPVPLERQLAGARRLWLVVCPWRFRDPPEVPADLEPVLSRRCGTPRVWRFPGVDVYLADVKR